MQPDIRDCPQVLNLNSSWKSQKSQKVKKKNKKTVIGKTHLIAMTYLNKDILYSYSEGCRSCLRQTCLSIYMKSSGVFIGSVHGPSVKCVFFLPHVRQVPISVRPYETSDISLTCTVRQWSVFTRVTSLTISWEGKIEWKREHYIFTPAKMQWFFGCT